MEDALATLETAIGDIGMFRWWDQRFPRVAQLEFGGVQLWAPPAPGQPPAATLALSFVDPVSVSFLTRGESLPDDWPARLHRDELDPPDVSAEEITLRDAAYAAELIARATRVDTVFGAPPGEVDWVAAPVKLVFWAGSAGAAIAAGSLNLVTHDGKVPLDEVPDAHARWWAYWREYWDRRDTADPLPKDWLCEVTIPILGSPPS